MRDTRRDVEYLLVLRSHKRAHVAIEFRNEKKENPDDSVFSTGPAVLSIAQT